MDSDEQLVIEELKHMSQEEIDKVPYQTLKWVCQCKNCTNGTKVRDYGISPEFYWGRKQQLWINLHQTFFLCAKHWKFFQRLRKSFTEYEVQNKLLDFSRSPIEKMIRIDDTKQQKKNSHKIIHNL